MTLRSILLLILNNFRFVCQFVRSRILYKRARDGVDRVLKGVVTEKDLIRRVLTENLPYNEGQEGDVKVPDHG